MSVFVQNLNRLLNQATWLDDAAKPLQKLVSQIFASEGFTREKIANVLNGTWLGHPLHPVLTDVPVGAWTAAVTLDVLETSTGESGIGKAADAAVALGVAGAVGSAITGLSDWQYTTGESRRTGFVHAMLNITALGFFIASLVERGGRNRGKGRSLALAGYAIAAASAYLGGDMVYRQRIGVNHSPDEETIETKDWVPIMDEGQLPEDTLTIGLLTNIPLVLLRRGERVYALAETCAHLGGPLADGKLVEGPDGEPAVVCPWHGSCFSLANGNVLKGPSAYPQPCFDARIHAGMVEVRRLAGES